jgi:hypothetical protein
VTDDREPHQERVNRAFDSLHEGLGEKLSDAHREDVERLRAAAADRDADALRAHLTSVKERDSWLYRELAAHPDVAALINELAVWGF